MAANEMPTSYFIISFFFLSWGRVCQLVLPHTDSLVLYGASLRLKQFYLNILFFLRSTFVVENDY